MDFLVLWEIGDPQDYWDHMVLLDNMGFTETVYLGQKMNLVFLEDLETQVRSLSL